MPPIRKLLCANRGEIAIRVFRAATELGIRTVAIYSHEDRVHLHRYKADESFLVGEGLTPVGAYLSIDEIIGIALDNQVDAIHPGYGFLSERAQFAERCLEAGIVFVGPSPTVLRRLGDKVSARRIAMECGVPVVPGTPDPVEDLATVEAFAQQHGLPVLLKAAHGGGGRGMRVVREREQLAGAFEGARQEAQKAFGDGTLFVERYLDRPRHIEVQIIGDRHGHLAHLFERDCSVQRRHQKLVEMAPAVNLAPEVRARMLEDALTLGRHVSYENAGTVEFLVDGDGRHYFIEVNPRIQVEHTVTEQVTGIDLVQSQILIAQGKSLEEIGIDQDLVGPRGHSIQCRITTEDPNQSFAPDTGTIEVYRSGSGMGIRIDGGSGYPGARISPYYDPLLAKVIASDRDFAGAVRKLDRALSEFRVRGVKTNIPFLLNVLQHSRFHAGEIDTHFVDQTPELFVFPRRRNRAQKLLRYIGDVVVNGPSIVGAQPTLRTGPVADAPKLTRRTPELPRGWRDLLLEDGPDAFARAVRRHPRVLITDTTWRDAHQSLLATRVRMCDLLNVADATADRLAAAYSLEMWGGATFDVAMRFLHECPWKRLALLREKVPNVPFQMLLRGANAVGYTSYPDNVVRRFIELAHREGIDVFRVFDSLNDLDNLRFACDVVREVGGVVEATVCYTGDVSDPRRTKYDLDYYLDLTRRLVERGTHVLAIKDMAGLLKPRAATLLIGALRREFPDLPLHLHTHDTAGNGVATLLAASAAGVDVVDLALPSMSGVTSQPSAGAFVCALDGGDPTTDLHWTDLEELDAYWEQVRQYYAPFESGLKSGSADVYEHEMPGGQYTNLKFQAQALGLSDRWPAIKKAYAAANRLLGDLVKVTPSSKVVGDLAQFMVQNDLTEDDVVERAEDLSFPESVVDFMRGGLGRPHGGFPEPLRSHILRGTPPYEGRPGASLPDFDFRALGRDLSARFELPLADTELVSAALYPKVFEDYLRQRDLFSDLAVLPTRCFLSGLEPGEEIAVEIEHGKTLIIKLETVGELTERGERPVFFELNGQPRTLLVPDQKLRAGEHVNERADSTEPGSVGAPMPGEVTEVRVEEGDEVARQAPLAVLSAMKMETVVSSPVAGRVRRVVARVGQTLAAGDLLVEIDTE